MPILALYFYQRPETCSKPCSIPSAAAGGGRDSSPCRPVGWLCLLHKVFVKAFLVASNMDSDRTFNSCSWPMEEGPALENACSSSDWTREEDKAFENALLNNYDDANMWDKIALAVPGKTIEDLKMHYESFIDDVGLDVIDQKERPSPKHGVQTRGTPWTEEEHRQFLYGLQRFGKGDWKSISRYSVRTKSNSQVASHAQKFFNRLSSSKEGKRLSINDIRTLNPETLLALEKATTSCMPGRCKEKSNNAGRPEELLPGCLEKTSTHAENQLLPECPKKSSADSRKQRMPRRSKRASTADGNKLLPRYPSGAPRSTGKKLLLESPEKAPTDTGNHLQPGYTKRDRSETGYQLIPPPPFACMSDGSRFSGKAIRIDTGNQPIEAATNLGNQLLPPPPFAGMSNDPIFSGQSIGGLSNSAPMLPTCCIPSPPFAIEPIQGPQPSIQEPGVSIEIPRSFPTDASMEDADIPVAGQFDFGFSTEFMDLDLSMFPHFLD